jgi:hypothetical protein
MIIINRRKLIRINKYVDGFRYTIFSVNDPKYLKFNIDILSKNGHLSLICLCTNYNKNENYCTKEALNWASRYGHLHIVKWLYNRNKGNVSNGIVNAMCYDYLNIIEWLYKNSKEKHTRCYIKTASCNGKLNVVKWFYENTNEKCNINDMYVIVERNNLNTAKWLYENIFKELPKNMINKLLDSADSNNNKNMLMWLCEISTDTEYLKNLYINNIYKQDLYEIIY